MPSPSIDRATVVGIALVAASSLLAMHEFLGHGLVGLALVPGPIFVTSTLVWFPHAETSAPVARAVICAGAVVNLIVFAVAAALLRARPPRGGTARYALWTFAVVHGYGCFGYLMTSFILKSGDFFAFSKTFATPAGALAAGVATTALGFVGYLNVMPRVAPAPVAPLIGRGDDRFARLRVLALTPYAVAIVVALVSTSASPIRSMSMRNAVATTVFGLIGLPLLARGKRFKDAAALPAEPLGVPRSPAWIAAGIVVFVALVATFGRGFQVRDSATPLRDQIVERMHAG